MEKSKKVGYKFCGNCNPQIDASDVLRRINGQFEQEELLVVTSKEDPEIEVLIVISGCPVDCAERPRGEYDQIVIAGETLNRQDCSQDSMPSKLLKLIKIKYLRFMS